MTTLTIGAHAQALQVTLLGTGTPILQPERSGPSILVGAGGEKLLFDVGRGAAGRLWQAHVPLRDISAVFFTHLHSDHTTGFPTSGSRGCCPTRPSRTARARCAFTAPRGPRP